MKFNKLKYHIIFLRQAEVQGLKGLEAQFCFNSVLFKEIDITILRKKWSNIWAADNHLLLWQRNQKHIMKWNCNRYSKDKRWKTNLADMKKDREPHFLS